ncbi:MAG: SHOCT domain-containing protein [Gaiellaceae bacterium]
MDLLTTDRPSGLAFVRRGFFLRKPRVGGVEILGRRLRREFALNTRPGENARLCLRGRFGHALVCLDDRLLILKRGFRAGTTFGAMAATIFYRDVTGIQVRMQLVSGWIEISSPSFQGSERKRAWDLRATDRDVFKQPNCVAIQRRHVPVYQVALSELRRLVAEAKLEPDHGGVVDQIERLAALRRQGVVSEDEFALAKSRILGDEADSGFAQPA